MRSRAMLRTPGRKRLDGRCVSSLRRPGATGIKGLLLLPGPRFVMAEKSPSRGWRQQGPKTTPTTTSAAGTGKRDWQRQTTPTAAPRRPWSRGSKLAFAAALLGVLVGGVYV